MARSESESSSFLLGLSLDDSWLMLGLRKLLKRCWMESTLLLSRLLEESSWLSLILARES